MFPLPGNPVIYVECFCLNKQQAGVKIQIYYLQNVNFPKLANKAVEKYRVQQSFSSVQV